MIYKRKINEYVKSSFHDDWPILPVYLILKRKVKWWQRKEEDSLRNTVWLFKRKKLETYRITRPKSHYGNSYVLALLSTRNII